MTRLESPATTLHANVRIDAGQRTPLRRIWRYAGYDEPNYTYTANGRELLQKLGRMDDGPYFIRTHYLLCSGDGTGRPKWGSSNAYTEDAAGNAVYDWTIVDRIFDTYLETGCVPFVEIGFMPEALTTAPAGTPYSDLREGGWRYPPRDYGRWQELIAALAAHCLERYGLREVRRWYWELWNEPDIFYWAGTVEEYCRLYDHSVAGLLGALPQAHVGGPGTTSPANPRAGEFLRRFLEHCVSGVNAVTGEQGTRLDFLSFHTKGGGYRRDDAAIKQTPTIATLLRHVDAGLAIAGSVPALAQREVVLTECDPDGMAAFGKRDNANLAFRNTEYYASYVASATCKLLDIGAGGPLRVDGMLTWAFQFENREYFEGLRTLSSNGIDKPVLNVFRMLARLGGLRLALHSDAARDPLIIPGGDSADTPPDVSGIAAIDGNNAVQVLLCSHHDDWDVTTATTVAMEIAGLPDGNYRVRQSLIDATHSNAHSVWQAMGAPQQPTDEQLLRLQQAGGLETVAESAVSASDGRLVLELTLAAQSVCLVEVTAG
jgi:xylan 1,4-beta-xylosidase